MNIFNRLLSYGESITKYDFTPSFSQDIFSRLTPTQLKIAAVASLALALIAAVYVSYRCFFANNASSSAAPSSPFVPKKDPKSPSAFTTGASPGFFKKPSGQEPSEILDDSKQTGNDPGSAKAPYDYSAYNFSSPSMTKKKVDDNVNFQDYVDDDDMDAIMAQIAADHAAANSHLKPSSPVMPKPFTGQQLFGGNAGIPQGNPYQPPSIPPVIQPAAGVVDPFKSPPASPKFVHKHAVDQPVIDDILRPLVDIERKIVELHNDLAEQKDILQALMAEAGGVDSDDMFTDQKETIAKLEGQLEKALESYPVVFKNYLFSRFKQNGYGNKRNDHEIFEQLVTLSGHMKKHKDNQNFIREAVNNIDLFLIHFFFTSTTESCIPEEKKVDLIIFHVFFSIVNEHYPLIAATDPDLAQRLKIKLANLPLRDDGDDHASFKNSYLSEADQRAILIAHFQEKEDQAVDLAIAQLQYQSFTEKDVKQLARELGEKRSRLSDSNRKKLRDALKVKMGYNAPQAWDDEQLICNRLKSSLNVSQNYNPYYADPYAAKTEISSLRLACKAKTYFVNQAEIPRWYHATNSLEAIIASGKIEVRHQQVYNGAWVSTHREFGFGDSVLVFNHSIAQLDPNVFIGYEKGGEKKRWRGIQKEIPLVKPGNPAAGINAVIPNVALVGLGNSHTKDTKQRVVQLLEKIGIAQPKVVANDVVDYIQRETLLKIGNPNLSEKWWGKADVKELDKALPKNDQ